MGEAKRLVIQRNNAIEKVSRIILMDPGETISGETLLDSVYCEPLVDVDPQIDLQLALRRSKGLEYNLTKDCKETKKALISAVREFSHILSGKTLNFYRKNEAVPAILRDSYETYSNTESPNRIRAVHEFATSVDSPFPPAPIRPKFLGPSLEDWLEPLLC